jgi:hypothetical protein
MGGGSSFELVEKFRDLLRLRSGFDFERERKRGVLGVYGGGVGTVMMIVLMYYNKKMIGNSVRKTDS